MSVWKWLAKQKNLETSKRKYTLFCLAQHYMINVINYNFFFSDFAVKQLTSETHRNYFDMQKMAEKRLIRFADYWNRCHCYAFTMKLTQTLE